MAKTASTKVRIVLLHTALGLSTIVVLALIIVAVSRLNPQGRAMLTGAICGELAAIPTSLVIARRSRRSDTPPRQTGPVEVVFIAPTSRLEAFDE